MTPNEIYEALGKNIRRLREKDHQTQAQLAAQIGISRASLANIEAGRQKVLLHHIFAIAETLSLDSPMSLLPIEKLHSAQTEDSSDLPMPEKGLTAKQRLEVVRLMGGTQNEENQNEGMEDK
tara:strand:- start:3654 stop:4019 length:366 start_codon:yes stop_codon:yes gene_type:complete